MDDEFSSMGPALQVLALIVLFVFLLAGLSLAIVLASRPGQIAAQREGIPRRSDQHLWMDRPAGMIAETDPHLGSLDNQRTKLEETLNRLGQQQKEAV